MGWVRMTMHGVELWTRRGEKNNWHESRRERVAQPLTPDSVGESHINTTCVCVCIAQHTRVSQRGCGRVNHARTPDQECIWPAMQQLKRRERSLLSWYLNGPFMHRKRTRKPERTTSPRITALHFAPYMSTKLLLAILPRLTSTHVCLLPQSAPSKLARSSFDTG